MTELAKITLENEMDLTLAYKRSITTASMLGLTMATQTAFATAVSEVCREIIDKATSGVAKLGTVSEAGRFSITALITADVDKEFNKRSEGFKYARKLLPVVDLTIIDNALQVYLKLAIPRSTRIDQRKILAIAKQIEADGPVSAYEEVKQRNAALSDLNQQHESALEEANFSNQQKTEFLSIASHELNSPLTVLRSYAQIALKIADDKDQKLKPYLVKIDQQTGKLIKLVRQLLDISKFEHGEFNYNYQPVNINAYLSSVIDNIRLIVDKHDIRLNVVEDAQVMIDEMRIEQVLSNLVSNAAKYSDVGTIITITTKIIDGQLVIAIADQGIGMSEESTIKVFEKFYRDNQIKMKYSGLGMGLYISSKIVQDHNGKITVISELDKGSVFSFGLPIVIS